MVRLTSDQQRTLSKAVECTGIGLHGGRPVHVRLLPASVDTGVVFLRTDLAVAGRGMPEVVASADAVDGVDHATMREEIALLGQDPTTRGRRMDEMLDVIRAFLDRGTVEYHGEFFDFGPTGIFPVPAQRVPIWVGGKSAPALRRAARHDGWLGMNYPMDEIRRLLPALGEARAAREDATGVGNETFETLVIPQVEPDERIYAELETSGVTSTVCTPWPLGDPAYASLDAKTDAMAKFARRFLEARQQA